MAKIGLDNFRYSILTEKEDGSPSYAGPKKLAKAISCNVEISTNEAKLYADNIQVESNRSFQSGTATIGIDDENLEVMADLLGHKLDEEKKQMTRNANDNAPYVGFGRIIMKQFENKISYKVEFLYKVKFAEPSQEDATKGESVEFSTAELEGEVSTLQDGRWSEVGTFDTHDEAVTFLEGLLAATPAA